MPTTAGRWTAVGFLAAAALVGAVVLAMVLATAAGAWYARRRWLR
jgi:hypothetical protein